MSKHQRKARRDYAVKEGHYDGRFGTKVVKASKKYNSQHNDLNQHVMYEDEILTDDEFYFWTAFEPEEDE